MNEDLQERERNPFEGWKISLQRELILESRMDKKEWILKYSAKYRKFIETNPQLVEEYQEDKDSVKEKIKNWLYQEETIH